MAQDLLGDVPSSSTSAIDEAMEPAYFLGSDKRMRYDSMPNAHVAFAFKAPEAGSKHALSIMMVQALLGESPREGGGGVTAWRKGRERGQVECCG